LDGERESEYRQQYALGGQDRLASKILILSIEPNELAIQVGSMPKLNGKLRDCVLWLSVLVQ